MKGHLALKVAGVIFFLVSLLHLFRLIFKVEVTMEGLVIPFGLSFVGFAVAFLLSVWIFKSIK
jgi:hypothetical protein